MKKDKNKAVTKDPQVNKDNQRADTDTTGIAAQLPGGPKEEENQITADKVTPTRAEAASDELFNDTSTNTYAQSAEVDSLKVVQENYPEAATQQDIGGNPASPTPFLATPEVLASSVEETAATPTSSPAAVNAGSEGEIHEADTSSPTAKKAIAGSAKRKSSPKQAARISRIYGVLYQAENTYFIKEGNVPEEQLQLRYPQQLEDQMDQYSGQYVTIAGELAQKNKAGSYPTLHVHKLASHDQIGRKAYELSQQNPDAHEANWLSAENELLQP